jgi:phosphomannomutase / phosphoglucomutase
MAKIDSEDVFRKDELDMRGKDVNPADFYLIGRNIVTKLKEKGVDVPQIVTGGDARPDTPELLEMLEKGIKNEGGAIISVGYDMPKPIAYVAGEQFQSNSVAYVTASHINVTHNGIKINFLRQTPNIQLSPGVLVDKRDEVVNFYKGYLKSIFAGVGIGKRAVVDSLYGTSCGMAQSIFEDLGFKVAGLHSYIDRNCKGLLDNAPDPHEPGNLEELMTLTKVWGDLGIALDGDVDRVSIVGEDGEKITEDEITMIIAEHLIKEAGGTPSVVYEIKSSNAVPEVIQRAGGNAEIQKTGWQNIKKKMAETGAIFGGEISGHNFYSKQFYYVPYGDDGLFTALMVSQILSNSKKTLSEFRTQFPVYFTSPELRVEYQENRNPDVVKELKRAFEIENYSLLVFDSDVRIERYEEKEWKSWAVVRTSKTEPKKLTICFEGKTLDDLNEMMQLFLAKIPKQDSKLRDIIQNAYDKAVGNPKIYYRRALNS